MQNFVLALAAALGVFAAQAAETTNSNWRQLPLVKNGQVSPDWVQIGYGGWEVDDGSIRTDPSPKGLGLLVYKTEKLGNCKIKVVFKPKEARSNSGVYVRIDNGILKQIKTPGAAFDRDAAGKPSPDSLEAMKETSERDEGAWYAVHHGYEVQIAGGGNPLHGTGSIYSLAESSGTKNAGPDKWHTMIITLDDTRISVQLDGQQVSSFDSASRNVGTRKEWSEPKREPKRPVKGYIGLQTHDPGDIVWFKEVSVEPLGK